MNFKLNICIIKMKNTPTINTSEGQTISEEDLKKIRRKVKALKKRPQPEQRTPEWYSARHKRITASEAASCLFNSKKTCEPYVQEFNIQNFKYKDTESLNHYETREDYIIKKCDSFYGKNVFKDTIYTLWGKKYEEVANTLYCQLNNTTVIEFGLVSHSRLKWLAASPDGITPDGVMLEIKCPKSRKIDESRVPIHYWIQTQIQMESIDLDVCDFFECEIEELESESQFIDREIVGKQAKGIVLQMANSGPDPKFIYSPHHIKTTIEYIDWKNQQMSLRQDLIPSYFFVKKYNNQRVHRSKIWFENVKDELKKTWNLLMHLQETKDNFYKYKESIHIIKSKKFYERYDATQCEIEDDTSTFIYNQNTKIENDKIENNQNTKIENNQNTKIENNKIENNQNTKINDKIENDKIENDKIENDKIENNQNTKINDKIEISEICLID